MSTYTFCEARCPQDVSIAAQTAQVIETLCQALETFRDKRPVDGLRDLHTAMLDWEEIIDGLNPQDGTELLISIETEGVRWDIDMYNPQWVIDLPLSLFHGKLMLSANAEQDD